MRIRLLVLCVLLFIPALVTQAQPPDPINSALADLSQRVGKTVSITDLGSWNFTQQLYPDTSLGCPQAGQVYAQVQTAGFQFTLVYAGQNYDYRVSANRQIVVLCGATAAPVPTDPATVCPPPNDAAFMPPRLRVGGQARVAPNGIPNNLRDQPGSSGQLLGEIPPGAVFTVQAGPRCSLLDKLIWWQVNFNGKIGWTGEGQAGTYWLEPLDAAGNPVTPIPPTAAPGAQTITRLTTANAGQVALMSNLDDKTGAVAVSPDGKLIVQALPDGTVRWYNPHSLGVSGSGLPAYGSLVTALAFGPDSKRLATGRQDGQVYVWDFVGPIETRQRFTLATPGVGAVTALAFSPDGALLAVGDATSGLRLWDMNTGGLLTTVSHGKPIRMVIFGPDGAFIVTIGDDGSARQWGIRAAG